MPLHADVRSNVISNWPPSRSTILKRPPDNAMVCGYCPKGLADKIALFRENDDNKYRSGDGSGSQNRSRAGTPSAAAIFRILPRLTFRSPRSTPLM